MRKDVGVSVMYPDEGQRRLVESSGWSLGDLSDGEVQELAWRVGNCVEEFRAELKARRTTPTLYDTMYNSFIVMPSEEARCDAECPTVSTTDNCLTEGTSVMVVRPPRYEVCR